MAFFQQYTGAAKACAGVRRHSGAVPGVSGGAAHSCERAVGEQRIVAGGGGGAAVFYGGLRLVSEHPFFWICAARHVSELVESL